MVKALALVWTRNIARICPLRTALAISTEPPCEDIQYHLKNALKNPRFFLGMIPKQGSGGSGYLNFQNAC